MSRRYGRNQRRRAREREAELLAQLRENNHLHEALRRDKQREVERRQRVERDMTEWAARVVNALGPSSAFARHLERRGVDLGLFKSLSEQGRYRVGLFEPLTVLPPHAKADLMGASAKVLDLLPLWATAEPQLARDAVLFEVVAPDGRAALVIDAQTLHNLRGTEDPTLARLLLAKLVGPWMRGEVR